MLTLSQKRTYNFVKHFVAENGHSPTVAEIAQGTGLRSRGVIYRYLKALAEAGKIHLIPKRHRNIQLIDENDSSNQQQPLSIPLVGVIAAGLPIHAIEQHEELSLTQYFAGKDLFALKVKGSSMIEEGILDGDMVICRPAIVADNGDIVVALIDQQEATLKRWESHGNGVITLLPANKTMESQSYAASRVTIQGIFIGLLRVS